VPDLRIFQHQAQAGDAVALQPAQVPLDRREVAAAEQALELDPADRVILPDRSPGRPVFGEEIRVAGRVRTQAGPGRCDGVTALERCAFPSRNMLGRSLAVR
jgi:hypothetical protein